MFSKIVELKKFRFYDAMWWDVWGGSGEGVENCVIMMQWGRVSGEGGRRTE